MSTQDTNHAGGTPEEGATLAGLLREHGAGVRAEGHAALAEGLPQVRGRVRRRRVAKVGAVAGTLAVAGVLALTGSQAAGWIRGDAEPLPGGTSTQRPQGEIPDGVTVSYQDGYVPDGWKQSGAFCGMPVADLEDLAEPTGIAGLTVGTTGEPVAYRERAGWWVPATVSGEAIAEAVQEPFLVWSQDGTVVDLGWSYASDGVHSIAEAETGQWWGPVRATPVTGCLPTPGADEPFDDRRYQHVREAGRFEVRVAVRTHDDDSGDSSLYLSEPRELETADGAGGPAGGAPRPEPDGSSWSGQFTPDWLTWSDVGCSASEEEVLAGSRAGAEWAFDLHEADLTTVLGRWEIPVTLTDGAGAPSLPYAPPVIILFDDGRLVGHGYPGPALAPATGGDGWGYAYSNAMNSCRVTPDGSRTRIPEGDYTARVMTVLDPGGDTQRFVWSDSLAVRVAEDGDLTAR
ncbi:hypothetical protein [Myceligenerans crystallogenes]|uniref:Uncharacterized protein n=1 Tax=Myceligenerans crystallogenes TaxID=316335 RepID=A0ABN2NIP8_9MICO